MRPVDRTFWYRFRAVTFTSFMMRISKWLNLKLKTLFLVLLATFTNVCIVHYAWPIVSETTFSKVSLIDDDVIMRIKLPHLLIADILHSWIRNTHASGAMLFVHSTSISFPYDWLVADDISTYINSAVITCNHRIHLNEIIIGIVNRERRTIPHFLVVHAVRALGKCDWLKGGNKRRLLLKSRWARWRQSH